MKAIREVYFLLLPHVMSLDITGPAGVLTLLGGFHLHYIGPQPDVVTSTGLTLGHIEPLPATLPDDSLVFVPGVSDSSKLAGAISPAMVATTQDALSLTALDAGLHLLRRAFGGACRFA